VDPDTYLHELGAIARGELAKDGPGKTIDALSGTGPRQRGGPSIGAEPASDISALRHVWRDRSDEVGSDLVSRVDDKRGVVRETALVVVDGAFHERRRAGALTAVGLRYGCGKALGGKEVGRERENTVLGVAQRRQKGGGEDDSEHDDGNGALHTALSQSTRD
jgi:hypothetical protein